MALVILPNCFAIFPTSCVRSDSSFAISLEAGTTTSHMKKEPPTNSTALKRWSQRIVMLSNGDNEFASLCRVITATARYSFFVRNRQHCGFCSDFVALAWMTLHSWRRKVVGGYNAPGGTRP